MENNTVDSTNYTIKGTYITTLNRKTISFSNINYLNKLKQLIEEYTQEKMYFELNNDRILKNIHFLNKRCNFINITHNNTINFIIKNYKEIKHVLDSLVHIYDENSNYINHINIKIYNINRTINNLFQNT
jgi:hypothetical protein